MNQIYCGILSFKFKHLRQKRNKVLISLSVSQEFFWFCFCFFLKTEREVASAYEITTLDKVDH